MIYASQITKTTSGYELFSDVSFFLPAGSYTQLVGESGSGKTTLLEMIAGIQRPDTGSLVVNEVDLSRITADRLPYFRREVGFVRSAVSLLENCSTKENVRMPLDIAGFDRRASNERVAQTLEELGLTVIADIPVQRLSNDQRWLIACARATIRKPKVLLMDDPAAISDSVLHRQQELENQLVREGTTILSTKAPPSHDQPTLTLELQRGRSFLNEHQTAAH